MTWTRVTWAPKNFGDTALPSVPPELGAAQRTEER